MRGPLILPGAGLPDRLLACAGALIGIGLTGWLCHLLLPDMTWLVAPMGASAVLVFAVPASPLAQPWPVVGGNTISAAVGVAVARMVPDPQQAAGVAVGAAILAMSLLRCLHPPGGAAALLAVIGGPAVASAGFGFALVPVGLNAAVLTLLGIGYHRISRHSYPHRTPPSRPAPPIAIEPQDVERAIAEFGEALDADPDDLLLLARRAAAHAATRAGGTARR